jgi:hypothetical protein
VRGSNYHLSKITRQTTDWLGFLAKSAGPSNLGGEYAVYMMAENRPDGLQTGLTARFCAAKP